MTPPQPDDVQTMSGRPAREVLAEDRSGLFHGIAPRTAVEQNLARTGYPSFRLIEGDVLTTLTSAPAAIAQVIQADLQKIGIKTNLKPTDPAAFVAVGAADEPACA